MTSASIGRVLTALRDVAGVHGSFVLPSTGELLGKDLPAVFHDELFVEVGARLSRFIETMAADGDDVTSAIMAVTLPWPRERHLVLDDPHFYDLRERVIGFLEGQAERSPRSSADSSPTAVPPVRKLTAA